MIQDIYLYYLRIESSESNRLNFKFGSNTLNQSMRILIFYIINFSLKIEKKRYISTIAIQICMNQNAELIVMAYFTFQIMLCNEKRQAPK